MLPEVLNPLIVWVGSTFPRRRLPWPGRLCQNKEHLVKNLFTKVLL